MHGRPVRADEVASEHIYIIDKALSRTWPPQAEAIGVRQGVLQPEGWLSFKRLP